MKKLTLSGIIIFMVFGITTAFLVRLQNKKNHDTLKNYPTKDTDPKTDISNSPIENDEISLGNIKMKSSSNIVERHNEATKIIKESLQKINEESDVAGNGKSEFDKMLDDLDRLSKDEVNE